MYVIVCIIFDMICVYNNYTLYVHSGVVHSSLVNEGCMIEMQSNLFWMLQMQRGLET